jgi:MFS family permease
MAVEPDARAAEPDSRTTKATPESAGDSALSWRAFISTYLPALVLALGTGIALPAVPILADSFDVGFGIASWVVTAFLIGNLVGTLPSGWLIDRYGLRLVLIGGPLLTLVAALLVAFASSFPELLAYRFIGGVGAQTWLVARLAVISQTSAPNQRGRQVTWMFGMDQAGKLAGPLVGGLVAASWSVCAPFLVYAGLALVILVLVAWPRAGEPRHARVTRQERAIRPRVSLREMVLPRLVYFGVAFFAGVTRAPVQADLLHLYAVFAYGLGPSQIGILATGAMAVTLPIGFVAGWIMDRYGRKRTMIPGFVGLLIAMAALAVSAYADLSLPWYIGLFLLAAIATALTGGSVQTVGADVAPEGARGTFLGIWRFTGQGGVTLSPVMFGLLASTLGYGSSFIFTALAAAAVAALLLRIPETRDPT